MENKNNISKLTKILFVALAMGMILISPYQLCNVAAADKYYGYQKKTKSVKTKITASKKKVRIKKKYRGTRTKKNVESKWSDSYKYTYGDAKKIHIKTVITTQKTYHGYFITTKRNIKTTTTENKINFVRNQKKVSFNGRIPSNVQKQLNSEKIQIVINPKLKHNGTFSLKDKKISIKYNSDYVLLHERGHFVNYKNGDAAHSSEFYNIYLKERSKYRGFYNDYYEKLDLGKYERTTPAEYFAGAYRDYYFSKDSRNRLKKYCPNTYNFITKYHFI